jgi:hypothetical protein
MGRLAASDAAVVGVEEADESEAGAAGLGDDPTSGGAEITSA